MLKQLQQGNVTFSFIGPPLEEMAKTVFYFALSKEDSLATSPFCHPALFLEKRGIRVISCDLPWHERGERPYEIQSLWSSDIQTIDRFLSSLTESIQMLISELKINPGVMGLSRGGFIASHIAARLSSIETILAFQPLTSLPSNPHFDLDLLAPKLGTKSIRFYIGHKDVRVHTEKVLSLMHKICEQKQALKSTDNSIDLVMKPSVGRDGHGTLDPVFEEGVEWITRHI